MKSNIVFLVSIVLLFVSFAVPLLADIPVEEREALIAFYKATNGDSWRWRSNSGWKEGPLEDDGFAARGTEGNWFGITVSGNHVTKIEMKRILIGTLPPELGNLSHLEVLYIEKALYLTGIIPPELGNLSHLHTLHLSKTLLTGSIPPELGNLGNLRVLMLTDNLLNGNIPPELGNLGNLEKLALRGWLFFRRIKVPEMKSGKFIKWKYIRQEKKLSGTIPPELGNLSNLEYLYLNNNELTGSMPRELGNLTRLKVLDLQRNKLDGPIPIKLGNLSNLEHLYLNNNELIGPIPVELGNLSQLQILDLSRNKLSGPIPVELGNLRSLKYLILAGNRLTGTIPRELVNLDGLQKLRLEGNRLSGRIHPGLSNLFAREVEISYNALYVDNSELKLHLDRWDSRWPNTQTTAPAGLKAVPISAGSVKVSWVPIIYQVGAGGYTVFYSTSATGPWTEAGTTVDKMSGSFMVTGLKPGEEYYFAVQTRSEPHRENQNTVVSEFSKPVSLKTNE